MKLTIGAYIKLFINILNLSVLYINMTVIAFRLTVSKLASFSVQIMTRLSGTSLAVSKDGDASPAGAGASGTVGKGGAAAGADLDVGEPKITTPQGAAQALISYFLTAQTL